MEVEASFGSKEFLAFSIKDLQLRLLEKVDIGITIISNMFNKNSKITFFYVTPHCFSKPQNRRANSSWLFCTRIIVWLHGAFMGFRRFHSFGSFFKSGSILLIMIRKDKDLSIIRKWVVISDNPPRDSFIYVRNKSMISINLRSHFS